MGRPKHLKCIALLGVCIASTVSAADKKAGDSNTLDEIIVTAQKRAESLQNIPLAISAISAKALENENVTDTNSFAKLVPNLHIKQGTTGVITLAIRGVSNNDPANPSFENAVGIYTDGVYAGKSVGSLFDLGDVERVEVLRGPQGTLYGRNTIGGAVNIISIRPSGELNGSVKFGVGSDNLRQANASIDLPGIGTANDGYGTLKARLSAFKREADGITNNVPQNFTTRSLPIARFARFGDIDRDGFHGAVDWEIRNNFLVAYDYTKFRAKDHQRLFQVIDVVRPGSMPVGFESYIPVGQPTVGSANQEPFYENDVDTHALTATWKISEAVTLKSITGYRKVKSNDAQDLDGSNVSFFESKRNYLNEQTSQELQLIGTEKQLKYVAGLYYSGETTEAYRVQQLSFGALIRRNYSFMDNKNEAVFGQVDYQPAALPDLTLSAGARYTKEHKEMSRYIRSYTNSAETFTLNGAGPDLFLPNLDFSNSSFMFSPSYRISDQLNVYARYADGFRSGGYDGQASTAAAAAVPYSSEKLKTYEIGAKSRWLNKRLEVNVAAFRSDYTDMQLTSYYGTIGAVVNAGKAKINGAELESKVLFTDRLRAALSLSFLDYSFGQFSLGAFGDVSNRAKMNNAPRKTANLAVDYDLPSPDFGKLALHVNLNYTDAVDVISIQSNGAAPNSRLPARSLLDARLTLSRIHVGKDAVLGFALWGTNLTDKVYLDNIVDFTSFRGGNLGRPRSVGLEASLNF